MGDAAFGPANGHHFTLIQQFGATRGQGRFEAGRAGIHFAVPRTFHTEAGKAAFKVPNGTSQAIRVHSVGPQLLHDGSVFGRKGTGWKLASRVVHRRTFGIAVDTVHGLGRLDPGQEVTPSEGPAIGWVRAGCAAVEIPWLWPFQRPCIKHRTASCAAAQGSKKGLFTTIDLAEHLLGPESANQSGCRFADQRVQALMLGTKAAAPLL